MSVRSKNVVKKIQAITRNYSGVPRGSDAVAKAFTKSRDKLAKKIKASRQLRTPYGMKGAKSVKRGKFGIQ